ncbi:hypothetical protein AGDE_13106 [Angomonas deanei]|uniref:Doublecortin, putative n=1 Tax=Angomonas deanei TaxID=59799 RepID=A0A7G2CFP5_9TRYP|nr:hypothetical protein AGDE_13106 [Angomonas deanei]CAD2218650.1 Doublecortin, putative [Angomonas deanei]|eukprot:EPY22802.1 hypothetical protein AGDE_13106 [Angomonas deanei]
MEAPKNREEGKEVSVEAPSAVPLAPAQPQPQSSPVELTDESSQIPKSCLPGYQAKFSIDDVASSIPRMNLGDKKSVAVALYTSGSKTPLQFKSIALYKKDLPSVLHVLSYIFRQECHNKPLTRIFTQNGVELKDGGNPTSHAQLVVTTGGDYEPLGASVSSGSASKKSPGVKAPTKKTPPSPSTGGPGKPIHIKVFENGLYGDDKFDRAYITVTIRPTYKTMTAVKSTITRELQWRDGRKVDALFDATGAEIETVDQLTDGAAIVASAGDRFVVPFPNTALHREAMKLNATLS